LRNFFICNSYNNAALWDLRVYLLGVEGGVSVGTYDRDPAHSSNSREVYFIYISSVSAPTVAGGHTDTIPA
jgi:hypothetical protein